MQLWLWPVDGGRGWCTKEFRTVAGAGSRPTRLPPEPSPFVMTGRRHRRRPAAPRGNGLVNALDAATGRVFRGSNGRKKLSTGAAGALIRDESQLWRGDQGGAIGIRTVSASGRHRSQEARFPCSRSRRRACRREHRPHRLPRLVHVQSRDRRFGIEQPRGSHVHALGHRGAWRYAACQHPRSTTQRRLGAERRGQRPAPEQTRRRIHLRRHGHRVATTQLGSARAERLGSA